MDKSKKPDTELRIRRVSPMMMEHVRNAAANAGVSITDFLKMRILNSLSELPKQYLEKPRFRD